MTLLSIAVKNIRKILGNPVLLLLMIGMPIFQVFIMKTVTGSTGLAVSSKEAFTQVVLLGQSSGLSIDRLFAASTLVQYLLIAGIIASSMIIAEKQDHTLMRVLSAPVNRVQVVGGYLLGQSIILMIVAASIIGITSILFDIQWGRVWWEVLVLTAVIIFVTVSMGFVFSGIFRNVKLATGVMSFIIIIMTFMSGGFTFDDKFDSIGRFTINKWAFDAYSMLMDGKGLSAITQNLLVLCILGTLFSLAAVFLYGRENIYE